MAAIELFQQDLKQKEGKTLLQIQKIVLSDNENTMVVFLQGGKRSFFTSQVQRTFNQKTSPK
jgi:hypothetical protein